MWMHMEERGYKLSNAAVAVSDSPTGPFRFIDCFRPVPGELHRQYSDRSDADQFERGSTFRDMTLFKDDDGKAWVIYAAESNYTMHIALLTDDYQGVRPPVQGKTWNRILVEEHREAPAIFKHAGSYYLITSGCKGWQPTEARLSVSTTILGPYRKVGNPCRGKNARTTFDSQGTFVLPIEPDKGRFMFMADRWNPKSIRDSTYVWLPLLLMDGKSPVIEWADRWSP
jgi:beta-xylosidase